jgi:hypothetical protein
MLPDAVVTDALLPFFEQPPLTYTSAAERRDDVDPLTTRPPLLPA